MHCLSWANVAPVVCIIKLILIVLRVNIICSHQCLCMWYHADMSLPYSLLERSLETMSREANKALVLAANSTYHRHVYLSAPDVINLRLSYPLRSLAGWLMSRQIFIPCVSHNNDGIEVSFDLRAPQDSRNHSLLA